MGSWLYIISLSLISCTKTEHLALENEALGIPLSHEELLNNGLSRLPAPFIAKEKSAGAWIITYPQCYVRMSALIEASNNATSKYAFLTVLPDNQAEGNFGMSTPDCPFKTLKGIGIGSRRSEVLKAYGRPTLKDSEAEKQNTSPRPFFLYSVKGTSEKCDLVFYFDEDKVIAFSLAFNKLSD